MIDNKITIKDDEMVNVQRGAIGHRATWTGLTYTKAREAGMEEAAEKIIRQAITETGQIQGKEIKANCQGNGLWLPSGRYHCRGMSNLQDYVF